MKFIGQVMTSDGRIGQMQLEAHTAIQALIQVAAFWGNLDAQIVGVQLESVRPAPSLVLPGNRLNIPKG